MAKRALAEWITFRYAASKTFYRGHGRHQMILATIFDMDGLLIDSEPLWETVQLLVFGELGVPITKELCALTRGFRIIELTRYWHERHPWHNLPVEKVADHVLQEVRSLVLSRGMLLPGALKAIDFARERCAKIALASSSPKELIDTVLQTFNIRSKFDLVHSADAEEFGKPHPAVYLSTAKGLALPPSACLALEDSVAGVIAAKAARMVCIAIPNQIQRNDPRFFVADVILDSLLQLDESVWKTLEETHP